MALVGAAIPPASGSSTFDVDTILMGPNSDKLTNTDDYVGMDVLHDGNGNLLTGISA